jgi:hypothetical protein
MSADSCRVGVHGAILREQYVYHAAGVPMYCCYTLAHSVVHDAVFRECKEHSRECKEQSD